MAINSLASRHRCRTSRDRLSGVAFEPACSRPARRPKVEESKMPTIEPLDPVLATASQQVRATPAGMTGVQSFFDHASSTITYVVHDERSMHGVIIDSVLDFDHASGRATYASAAQVANFVRAKGIKIDWILETHAHADHLSAAPWLQNELGGQIAIGAMIAEVQRTFAPIFNQRANAFESGSEFDRLWSDGDQFLIGTLPATVLHVPGHTPACVAYVLGDVVFVGDTMFMPDYGSARADFPGGDARFLYRSLRRILALPEHTRLFMCHDYLTETRCEHRWEVTVSEQRRSNIHARDGISEDEFVEFRMKRDAQLAMPQLLLPSIQVNIHAGRLPKPEENNVSYLKLPLNQF